ncbi:hypothetical protein [Rhodococcus sp. B50]|uniref:hypothetical protein n=1 Tax=Rhodococcus sp. B50 TaxID=2682847 RepID=UPI0019D8B588|nr:hypothetical protein [Rhodococcus sp. B50]MBS9373989.1 hypothetical protein [Rhodococcus sp. B50]
MTDDDMTGAPYRNGVGSTSLIAGIAAAVFAFVPFIGDFITIPAGVIAVVCGWIGLNRVDKGVASNPRDAVIGAGLGVAALFVVFIVYAATYSTP